MLPVVFNQQFSLKKHTVVFFLLASTPDTPASSLVSAADDSGELSYGL